MDSSTADMCSRCASIPWDDLEYMDTEPFWIDENPTLTDLQASSCRLCRLITSAVVRLIPNAHLQSVVNMLWNRMPETVNVCPGSLSIYTISGDAGLQFAGELILTTGGVTAWSTAAPKRVDFAKVRPGLEACKASHKSCEPAKSLQLHNLRVIDCVREAVVMAPTACSFVALSYVWGELSADSYVLESQIALPPTIEDAVKSTRELGYQYLWVDRYCINQGDPSDKREQISQMGRIYASAQLTIVAAAGVDPFHGLEGISRDRKPAWCTEPIGSSKLLYLFSHIAQENIVSSSWFTRAWTLQEGYLSKRILCFTECEVIFTCKSCSCVAEFDPRPQGRNRDITRGVEESVKTALGSQAASLLDATKIMQIYSRRVRGHQSDMLNAIIGILNVMKDGRSPVYHIWGVPFTITRRLDPAHSTDCAVSISLTWYHIVRSRRLPEYPSWSTLGWLGPVDHRSEPEVTPHFMIKYWSGDRYQELDKGTCGLNYTFCGDITHRSQSLEITTDVVQVEPLGQCRGDLLGSYYIQPTFIRRKEVKDQKEVCPNRDVQRPLFSLILDDENFFDNTLPLVCATMTPEINSESWSSFLDKHPLLLVFQQKEKSYERIGVCYPEVYTIDKKGEYKWSNPSNWEFVPPGEPGAWDQVAERRTFLLG